MGVEHKMVIITKTSINEVGNNMEKINNSNHIWNIIINEINNTTIEVETKRLNKKNGVWFSVSLSNDNLIIDKSKNKPSSSFKYQRRIDKKEFSKISPYYYQWKNKEKPRSYLSNHSKNTSYILAIINYYEEIIERKSTTHKNHAE